MSDLVLATSNQGKVRELDRVLASLGFRLLAQTELAVPEVEETGLSFVENAILKARNAAQHSGLPAIADDSGIEVDYLNGAPGIYSARYAGVGASDQANREKLLTQLDGVPANQRTARFQCALVYLGHAHDPMPLICVGTWHGHIATTARGEHGFGYDPIFLPLTKSKTAAELAPALKQKISHRGQALVKLAAALAERER